jgi:hypothetical protein
MLVVLVCALSQASLAAAARTGAHSLSNTSYLHAVRCHLQYSTWAFIDMSCNLQNDGIS